MPCDCKQGQCDMRRFFGILTTTAFISCGAAWTHTVRAEDGDARPLRSAIQIHGTKNAPLLTRSQKRAQIPGRSCRAKVCAGAAIGAGVGAVVGAVGVGSDGNRGGGAALGAIIFSVLGAGFGYEACGP